MRITEKKENISYDDTQNFFNRRAKKYNKDNPYSVTMYQDNHPELVRARNKKEVEKLLPKLKLDNNSKVLDIACGIGRWSDAIACEIDSYTGVDFCEDFIKMATERSERFNNRQFLVANTTKVKECVELNNLGKFNRVLIIGALVYLNDEDLTNSLKNIETVLDENCMICIREPIGIEKRLTLKEQFSDELNDMYNAIYRSREELEEVFEKTLLNKGFVIEEKAFLFDDNSLNNRSETAQYYYILRR